MVYLKEVGKEFAMVGTMIKKNVGNRKTGSILRCL